jgi:serine/threonine protein kinase
LAVICVHLRASVANSGDFPMANSSAEHNVLNDLAEEFAERHRRGERPDMAEYIARHPQLAEQIRELFPALVIMEHVRPGAADVTGAYAGLSDPGIARLERLGDYRILREVGRGGMGIVYEAEQESLGRHVALKVLPSHALIDEKYLQRFQREARAAAKLHHTNIVPVYGVGHDDGLHYYVMQFIQGLALDEVLDELKRLRRSRQEPATTEDASPAKRSAPVSDISAVEVAHALLTGDFTSASREAPLPPPPLGGEGSGVRGSDSSVHLPGSSGHSSLSESGRQYWLSVARIGIQVAEALAYAHGQGTLHRDIKPSNLLLDTHGTVWITDFGLAKEADSGDLTHTGDLVGTLRYMAPERFAGQSDPRSDLYGLGLTLYELLTLRPAFEVSDRNRLIALVQREEPPRPRKLCPEVPRDLETIVLKAIAKEADHRYATASALAEDLKRFVEDKPIQARRVSQVERLWRWCRRNPVVAGLSAGLAAALLAGTAISIAFAVRADAQRKNADAFATEANREREYAKDRADEARQEQQRAVKAEDKLELALARSLVRPLALARPVISGMFGEVRVETLSELEAEALWELAQEPGERLWFRVVEMAADSPLTAGQLSTRAEPALIAAVGLDPDKRRRTAQLLGKRFQAKGLNLRHQFDLVSTAVILGDMEPANAAKAADILLEVLAHPDVLAMPDRTLVYRDEVVEMLVNVAGRLRAGESDQVLRHAARVLVQEVEKEPIGSWDGRRLVRCLAAVAAKVEPSEAVTLFTEAMVKAPSDDDRSAFAHELKTVAARLEPGEATRVLGQALEKEKGEGTSTAGSLAYGWVDAVKRLEPGKAVDILTHALDKQEGNPRQALAFGLVAVAERLEPRKAARLLAQTLEKESHDSAREALASGLLSVAVRLEPSEATRVLMQVVEKQTDAGRRRALVHKLADLAKPQPSFALASHASRLESAEVARKSKLACRLMIHAMQSEKDGTELFNQAMKLADLAAHLEQPDEAHLALEQAGRFLSQAIPKEAYPEGRRIDAEQLAAVAGRLEPSQAARLVEPAVRFLIEALAKETNDKVRVIYADGLAVVAVHPESSEAATIAAPVLAEALHKVTDLNEMRKLAERLAGVAPRLERNEAARLLGSAVRALHGALEKQLEGYVRLPWPAYGPAGNQPAPPPTPGQQALAEALAVAEGLVAIAKRLEPGEGSRELNRTAKRFANALQEQKGSFARLELARGMSRVAVKLDPVEAARMVERAAGLLSKAVTEEDYQLAEGLAAVAERLQPSEAAPILTESLTIVKNGAGSLIHRLQVVARQLEVHEAARVLSQALDKRAGVEGRYPLALELVAVAARLKTDEAIRVLTHALDKEKQAMARQALAEGLAGMAPRLSAAKATEVGNQAIQKLMQAAEAEKNRGNRYQLEGGIARLIQTLDPELANRYSKQLAFKQVSGAEVSSGDRFLFNVDITENLDSYLTDAGRQEASQRAAAVATAIGLASGHPLAQLPALPSTSKTRPCRLSTQDLVELLKMPTCFGGARKIVLKHLGNRYGRTFANHWDFVRYAKEQHLDLDFTTPPKRPARP